ncbi:MAG: hypothetical protein KAH96_04340, partial [Alphaproteobacteria bacterium]|nr:hypothetical protein [Alphaproteobacteria bacterium]
LLLIQATICLFRKITTLFLLYWRKPIFARYYNKIPAFAGMTISGKILCFVSDVWIESIL